ncbi:hypothetical protein [Thiomonas sp.]|jgi:hypothetical protein|uniref:hypothetical protein n=1 Tax=Thiomonas sp. TaxID=2047785 RepID=UPI002628519B|nr:hypothetical protein [Thiomonas sp.]
MTRNGFERLLQHLAGSLALGLVAGLAHAAQVQPTEQTAPVPGYAPNLPSTVTRASVLSPLPPASRPQNWYPGVTIGPQRIGGPPPQTRQSQTQTAPAK